MKFLGLVLLAGTLTGCTDPIIGDWVSTETIAGEYNEMEVEDDLEGDATLYFFIGDDAYVADFDIEVVPDGGGEYEIEFECVGDCSEIDFTADCELGSDGDELECEGNDTFENYEFEWEIDE